MSRTAYSYSIHIKNKIFKYRIYNFIFLERHTEASVLVYVFMRSHETFIYYRPIWWKYLKVTKNKVYGNAEKENQYVLLKKAFVGFLYFSVFIQSSFPGLATSVMFPVEGFQSEEWILTTALHYSKVGDELSTPDENRTGWGVLETFLFAGNQKLLHSLF